MDSHHIACDASRMYHSNRATWQWWWWWRWWWSDGPLSCCVQSCGCDQMLYDVLHARYEFSDVVCHHLTHISLCYRVFLSAVAFMLQLQLLFLLLLVLKLLSAGFSPGFIFIISIGGVERECRGFHTLMLQNVSQNYVHNKNVIEK